MGLGRLPTGEVPPLPDVPALDHMPQNDYLRGYGGPCMSRLLSISFLLLAFAIPVRSESQPSEVDRLIKQLGSDSFAEREAASKALGAIGEPALEALRKAVETGDDAEVRWRAKQVVQSVEARMYRELRCFKGHTASVYSVAFSPDGKRALSGSLDKTMRLWEVDTGKELRRFESHKGWFFSVAFSPDGKQVLSGNNDKKARLWTVDVQTGKELRRFEGHTGDVYGATFSPDGKRIASASDDKTLRLWDIQTGKELSRFTGHTVDVMCLVFSPDGSGCSQVAATRQCVCGTRRRARNYGVSRATLGSPMWRSARTVSGFFPVATMAPYGFGVCRWTKNCAVLVVIRDVY
jgi:hypothetical protein